MKDDGCNGKNIKEFIGLTAAMYSVKIDWIDTAIKIN